VTDREANRFSARAARYARVGANMSGVAARIAGARLFGLALDRGKNAIELAAALGGLKGPIMKVAQLMATIPDALPPEYAAELMKLQSEAPPMGWAFVKRRMAAELGPHWQKKFLEFEHHPAAAASLGQVHRARSHDGAELACKLQYPDMQSAVEADLRQLRLYCGAAPQAEVGAVRAPVSAASDHRRTSRRSDDGRLHQWGRARTRERQKRRLTPQIRREFKRPAAIEPVIGHFKGTPPHGPQSPCRCRSRRGRPQLSPPRAPARRILCDQHRRIVAPGRPCMPRGSSLSAAVNAACTMLS
jgi:ABC1 atypical kinase-like domain